MQYVVNLIAILAVGLIVFGAVQFQKTRAFDNFMYNVQRSGKNWQKFVDTKKHNIEIETAPTRRPPLTFIDRESQLRSYLPEFFGKFSSSEWLQFWQIIYMPIEEGGAKRYRTVEEIESFLKEKYHDPFSNFQDEHWHYFWDIVKLEG